MGAWEATPVLFALEKISIISGSSIQKRNARRSTESEINGVDDKISKIVWTKKLVCTSPRLGHEMQ